jgi:ADP-heptose:LPS heptosyltransferase
MEFMDSHGEKPLVRMVGQDHMEPGRSHMLKMANEIQQSKLFVGPDSGGFHMAAALGVPTVASFTDKFPAKMRSYPKVVAAGDDLDEVFALALAMHRKNLRDEH